MTGVLLFRRSLLAGLVFLLIVHANLAPAEDAPAAAAAQPVKVDADDPNIQYIGRFDFSDPKKPECSWSGSTIRARFRGASIAVFIEDHPPNWRDDTGEAFRNRFEILIDGKPVKTLIAQPFMGPYQVARRLSDDVHTVTIFKRTQAIVGSCSFGGFQLPPGGELLDPPPRSARRIEFIGDSITAGQDLMKMGTGAFCLAAENNYLAYAAVTARNLGAEAVCLAYSGNGVHCNSSGGKQGTMPALYSRTILQDPKSKWDFTSWKPDVVVIHLGTNDCAASGMGACRDDLSEFVDSYVAFIGQVRKHYGDVRVFCAIGPSYWPGGLPKRFVSRVVKTMNDKGDGKVYYVQFDDAGRDLHPNAANHKKMAGTLTRAIRAETGWKDE